MNTTHKLLATAAAPAVLRAMEASENVPRLMASARREFPGFYAKGTVRDIGLLDSLVMAHAALLIGINAPRENVAPVILVELERATNANEQFFTDIREAVRTCPAFGAVSEAERRQIDRILFNIAAPDCPISG